MYNPPPLQTSRLKLRPFTMDDAGDVFRYASDAEFSKYLSYDAPSKENDVVDFLTLVLAGEMGANLWAIVLTAQPEAIGAIQLDIESFGVASLHYEIARWLWGQGLASEAVAAVLAWAKAAHPELVKIEAEVHTENAASRRVLEKFGFEPIATEGNSARYAKFTTRSRLLQ